MTEFEALPKARFDGLATFLQLVEESGTWPEDLPHAYVVHGPQNRK